MYDDGLVSQFTSHIIVFMVSIVQQPSHTMETVELVAGAFASSPILIGSISSWPDCHLPESKVTL